MINASIFQHNFGGQIITLLLLLEYIKITLIHAKIIYFERAVDTKYLIIEYLYWFKEPKDIVNMSRAKQLDRLIDVNCKSFCFEKIHVCRLVFLLIPLFEIRGWGYTYKCSKLEMYIMHYVYWNYNTINGFPSVSPFIICFK